MARRKQLRFEVRGRGRAEKRGVAKLPAKQRQKRSLLVTGTGRCGTTWLSRVLTKCGLDMPHEYTGADGCVSHSFAADSDWYPYFPWDKKHRKIHVGERKSDFKFDIELLLVRHPLPTIASLSAVFLGIEYEWLEDNDIIPKGITDKTLRSMYVWHNVNAMLFNGGLGFFRMEDLIRTDQLGRQTWEDFRTMVQEETSLKLPEQRPEIPRVNKGSGFRKPKPVTWKDLERRSAVLTRDIRVLTAAMGYRP